MDSKEKIIELLLRDRVSLYRELGRQEGVAEHGGTRHQHAEMRPVQSGIGPEVGEPQDAFPDAYYAAHSWLNAHRKELQERLIAVFGHAKRESYTRGKEAELVTAISEAIGDVVGGNVAPVLVAAILFKEGLDGLWFGYRDMDDHVREMVGYFSSIGDDESSMKILKRALEKDPESPEANYRCGSILLDLGRWTEAIEYFEKAIESNPTHHLALNALGFILIEYAVEPRKGFEYAKRALDMTWRGSWEEAGVLDTVGWAYYEQERDLVRAAEYLHQSVALTLPTEPYHITVSYHLLAVLVEAGKVVEARGIFERILPLVPQNPIDKKCYQEARKLMLRA